VLAEATEMGPSSGNGSLRGLGGGKSSQLVMRTGAKVLPAGRETVASPHVWRCRPPAVNHEHDRGKMLARGGPRE
jgi:hypothetical protein